MPIDMAFVQAEHGAHLRSREIVPFESPDGDSSLTDFPSLPLDLIAPIAAETSEIIIERVKILILPVKLKAGSRKKPNLF